MKTDTGTKRLLVQYVIDWCHGSADLTSLITSQLSTLWVNRVTSANLELVYGIRRGMGLLGLIHSIIYKSPP